MDSTTVSSFAPLEYYKHLTNCLANRKNLKLNLSKVHGTKNIANKNIPFTSRKIQSKFLAKYTNLKRYSSQKLHFGAKDAIFNIKSNNEVNEKEKHKKEDESSYINLPESYFKEANAPDLSIFKVPAVPIKKHMPDEKNSITTTNFTLTSLFSGNFNPQQFSTPKDINAVREEPKPLIADPDELLQSIHESQKIDQAAEEEEEVEKLRIEKEAADKLKAQQEEIKEYVTYLNELSDVGKYLDSVCFEKSDPTEIILKKLNSKYEDASQSPRESLVSITKKNDLETPKSDLNNTTQSWPVPVFYGQENDEENENVQELEGDDPDDDSYYESLFDFTKDIFGFLEQDDDDPLAFKCIATPPSKFNRKIESTSNFLFGTPKIWSSSSTSSFVMQEAMSFTPFPCNEPPKYVSKNKDDIEWLEEAFTSQLDMDMSWESDYSMTSVKYEENNNFRSDLTAIFRSPPKNSVEESFSRIISRPKKIFKEELNDDYSNKKNYSWWQAKGVKSDPSIIVNQTSNVFDNNFSLF